jgi:hypothetical protein
MIATREGAILLTDAGTRVRRITSEGLVTTLAGGELEGFADGPGAAARFDGASGLAMDVHGHVFVVETSGRIRKISATGFVSTFAGSGTAGSKDGPLLEATFTGPTGIALAGNGDIFILEPDHHRVRKISGGRVTTLHRGIPSAD